MALASREKQRTPPATIATLASDSAGGVKNSGATMNRFLVHCSGRNSVRAASHALATPGSRPGNWPSLVTTSGTAGVAGGATRIAAPREALTTRARLELGVIVCGPRAMPAPVDGGHRASGMR